MGRTKATQANERSELKKRLAAAEKVARQLKDWRPAHEVLERVVAQPTIFPQFDVSTRIGGWPMSRVGLVHGPSSHGKTAFCLGLGKSYLAGGHFFAYVDAEMTTPEDWTAKLMGEHARWPTFLANRPHDYEEVVGGVRSLVNSVADSRKSGELPESTSALIVIDSIRKLIPSGLLSKMLSGKAGLDGASGRAAMMKAALNSQWLDELTPLLYHTRTSLIFIARETDNSDPKAKAWDPKYKVGGGRALLYDSALGIRVSLAGRIKVKTQKKGEAYDEKEDVSYGDRHRVEIHKTKVAARDGKASLSYFHTSNGKLVPEGFDRARDVLELGVDAGLIDGKGWLSYGDERLGQGEHNAVKHLTVYPDLRERIEAEVRALWPNGKPGVAA